MSLLNNRIDDLQPNVAQKCRDFLAKCKASKMDVRINETKRPLTLQLLYAVQYYFPLEDVNYARKALGMWPISEADNKKKITWTLRSKHIEGLAFDAVPYMDGLPWWNAPISVWEDMGRIGESCGLKWGGRWKTMDCPHFEVET